MGPPLWPYPRIKVPENCRNIAGKFLRSVQIRFLSVFRKKNRNCTDGIRKKKNPFFFRFLSDFRKFLPNPFYFRFFSVFSFKKRNLTDITAKIFNPFFLRFFFRFFIFKNVKKTQSGF